MYGQKRPAPILRYLKKILIMYIISVLLYIPVGIYAGHYRKLKLLSIMRMLFFDGSFYHLWYFPALIIGVLITCIMLRFFRPRVCTVIAVVLYFFGLFGDSYWGLTCRITGISSIYELGFKIFTYTRNGLFFAPLFLIMGAWLGRKGDGGNTKKNLIAFAASFFLMAAESFILHLYGLPRHDSMYLTLPACVFFLYRLLLSWNKKPSKLLRTTSVWIYILHPAVIITVRGIAKIFPSADFLVRNSLLHYLAVCILSAFVSFSLAFILAYIKKEPYVKDRAWIELDGGALRHNVSVLRSLLPETCELMPAVKADAYGHGAVPVSAALNKMGVNAFCVACISEGITLRKNGIKGEILILGYTHPKQLPLLRRYRLIQTVIDYTYAEKLNRYGKKLRVHIGIDTGMRRLGERSENIDLLCKIFEMKNLIIEGVFTHLCADDTDSPRGKEFTQKQAQAFFNVINELKHRGFDCPKVHLQSSYGILNYPELAGDYARVGIALYGVRSAKNDYDSSKAELIPVLSMKARVASVRKLLAGESAGYGLSFTADRTMKLATLTVGYADGLPRALSCGVGSVLINGKRAPIVGRICMDQTTVDITDIPDAHTGDIAVIIGKSGDEEISVYELADKSGTITNEILSRMGPRLNRITIDSSTSKNK